MSKPSTRKQGRGCDNEDAEVVISPKRVKVEVSPKVERIIAEPRLKEIDIAAIGFAPETAAARAAPCLNELPNIQSQDLTAAALDAQLSAAIEEVNERKLAVANSVRVAQAASDRRAAAQAELQRETQKLAAAGKARSVATKDLVAAERARARIQAVIDERAKLQRRLKEIEDSVTA